MAAEPALDPILAEGEEDEEDEEDDDGEEGDVYEDSEEAGESDYEEEEEEEGDAREGLDQGPQENMTALLLGEQNGATGAEYDDEDEDEDYHDNTGGIDDNQTDISSSVIGSKRGLSELGDEGELNNDDDDEAEAVTNKKARV